MPTTKQNFAVSYFLSRALFLGIGFSLIINKVKQDSILAFILGSIIGLFLTFLINKVIIYKGEKTIGELLKEMKFLGLILRIIFIIFGVSMIIEGIVFFELFASSFLLSQSPLWFISLPIIYLVLKLAKGGIKSAFRVALCLFPLSLILTFLSLFSLLGYASLDNILPILVSKPFAFFESSLYYASLSATPGILMLITQSKTSNHKAYLLGSFTLIFKIFLIIGILGTTLASIYRFPEYVILKEIKILDFIEKIENIVGISWILDNFIFISISSLFLKEMLPEKFRKISFPSIILILFFISAMIIGKDYNYIVLIYYNLPIFLLIIFILTIPTLLIYTKFGQKRKMT